MFLVQLNYEISFNDADDGLSYAGDGQKTIKAFYDLQKAKAFINRIQPIIVEAGKEKTIFPVQKNNKILKMELGFTLHFFDSASNFKLSVEEIEIEQ